MGGYSTNLHCSDKFVQDRDLPGYLRVLNLTTSRQWSINLINGRHTHTQHTHTTHTHTTHTHTHHTHTHCLHCINSPAPGLCRSKQGLLPQSSDTPSLCNHQVCNLCNDKTTSMIIAGDRHTSSGSVLQTWRHIAAALVPLQPSETSL